MNLRTDPGFLGTNASALADLTLLAYILIIVPIMLIGFYFARRKWFVPHHKLAMTGVMLFNWVFIIFVMAVSYSDAVAPNVPDNLDQTATWLPTVHLVFGATAQLLATYLVGRMWFENVLPSWSKVKNIKLYMRATLVLWLATAGLGIGLYVNWYTPVVADSSSGTGIPVSTEEPNSDSAPISTEEADSAEQPTETEAAEPSAAPIATEEPESADASTETEEPAQSDEPVATEETNPEEPLITEEPG